MDNPHAGRPFTDDDASVARMLEDVSVPALLCSLVHITGDPSWIRGDLRPRGIMMNEYQGYMSDEARAEARSRALPAIAAYRDGGCVAPDAPSEDLLREMMDFLACEHVADDVAPMFLEDLQIASPDHARVTWGDSIAAEVRDASPVLVIGAGQSGLLAGLRLQQAGLPFTIVEKNAGPGGTWWENRYPGARVDTGSHFYCYSFEPSDHWTEYFSQQAELRAYFERVMKAHDLDRTIRFQTEVTAARWVEDKARWVVTLRNPDGSVEDVEAWAIISSVGALNRPKLPDLPGIDDFEGPSFHSAEWDPDIDITGKRMALVGAGASGFQIAPTVAPQVEHLTVFQRTAQWMFPNAVYHEAVPPGETWAMRHLPFYARWFRFLTFYPGAGLSIENSRVDPNWDDSDGLSISARNQALRKMWTDWMLEQIPNRPDLVDKVVPDYPATGKRTLQDNGSWLNCLIRENVELVRTQIERITPTGVRTVDGKEYPADVICYATGFRHNDFLWPMEITGRDGRVLRDEWGETPTAFLGITVPGFPNLFCLYGPGTNLAHGAALIFQSECQMSYVMDGLHHMLANGVRTMDVTEAAHDDYRARYRAEIDQMVWSHWSVKHSHYKAPDGHIYTLSPWPIPQYWQWTKHIDPADYTFA